MNLKTSFKLLFLIFAALFQFLPALKADDSIKRLDRLAQGVNGTPGEPVSASLSRGLLNSAGTSVLTPATILATSTQAVTTVALAADNQAVDVTSSANLTVFLLNSDNATSTARTFTLSGTPRAGQVIVLLGGATNASELADSGTTRLSATWTVGAGDTLTLIYADSNWNETARANN